LYRGVPAAPSADAGASSHKREPEQQLRWVVLARAGVDREMLTC